MQAATALLAMALLLLPLLCLCCLTASFSDMICRCFSPSTSLRSMASCKQAQACHSQIDEHQTVGKGRHKDRQVC
jgi:hypothetical protein